MTNLLLTGQETERLKFRLLNRNDYDTWIDLFKDASVKHFLGMASLSSAEEQCNKWFEVCENRIKNNLGGMNALVDKQTNRLVGQCGLLIQEVEGVQEVEIGYSVLPKYWGMGFASEAAIKSRDYAFLNSLSESLISIVHVDNIKSEKVAIRNGMAKTKQIIYKEMPVNVFRINKTDWQGKQETRS